MGLWKDENGLTIEIDDNYASRMGYEPVGNEAVSGAVQGAAQQARGEERGALGTLNSALTGAASAITLGGSDAVLGEALTPLEKQRANAEIEANPEARIGGEIAGGILASFAAPGSMAAKTPAGFLSNSMAQGVERSLASGSVAGTAKALGYMGAEGAAQNAGQYIGRAALADKEVTAEGLAGAAGMGFGFGAAGGGALLGIQKGTIAARKLFSKVMDGGEDAAKAAEGAWSRESQAVLDADQANYDIAKKRYDDIQVAKSAAALEKQKAVAFAKQEQVLARDAARPQPPITPPNAEWPLPQRAYGEQYGPAENMGPRPPEFTDQPVFGPDAGLPAKPTTGDATIQIPKDQLARVRAKAPPGGEVTDLERQLAGTRDALAEGKPLRDVGADVPRNQFADEATNAGRRPVPKEEPPIAKELGLAKDEDALLSALDEFEAARGDFINKVTDLPEGFYPGAKGRVAQIDATADAYRGSAAYNDMPDLPRGSSAVDPTGEAITLPEPTAEATGMLTGKQRAKKFAALEAEHEDILARAEAAATPEEAQSLIEQASRVEASMQPYASTDKLLDDVARNAKVIERYERASKKLAEAVGDAAHPKSVELADGLSAAEKEADRAVMDRMTRRAEDAEMYGPYEQVGPEYMSPGKRVAYAKARKGEADAKLSDLRTQEMEAKAALDASKSKVDAGEKAKAAMPDTAIPQKMGRGAKIANAATAAEIFDIPGMPKPSDIPVVGPLLGMWLKMRAVKGVGSRFAGRVPVSANMKVAALASKTRDRVGKAIEASLNRTEAQARTAMRAAPNLAGILSSRLYDDGGPDAPKGASIPELATVRAREVTALAGNHREIIKRVRMELRDVTDPDVIAAAEKHRIAMIQYLAKHAPAMPPVNPFARTEPRMSGAQAMSWSRRYEAAHDPAGVFERIEHAREMLTLEAAETLREVYPRLFEQAQVFMLDRVTRLKNPVPAPTRQRMSLLFDVALDSSFEPDNIALLQSVYAKPAPAMPAPGAQPPMPSLAGPTNMTSLFQTTADRRASE